MASTKFSLFPWTGIMSKPPLPKDRINTVVTFISSQQQTEQSTEEVKEEVKSPEPPLLPPQEGGVKERLRPVEVQRNVKSKNLSKEFGGQWLSSVTRHVRIFAAYIDPETLEMDQSQMDKLTMILDPGCEFEWTPETCDMVFAYFQDLVDHYEGAPLTEYTLRLIGSDVEHYIRKMLYDGLIKYNMNCRVLNFSMGKPRVGFCYTDEQFQDVNQ
ncbi:NAD(P)H-quinone oxidoreductase subunit M, chloroplastic [Impatiens glandulifera]|uniref:NAD(P)H-quinone oxidoreductase subunit M, chloroplastic n=1 Tax=Impatiens glandulifera TaxID=253017 RepID=UPI001FB19CFF|nr:NAD(P)H-quinone oxidoreductase subunit M, chloroplastic [Impatiens glandulifera]